MALILADVGAESVLKAYFNNVWPGGGKDLTLKLYTNDKVPADTDVAGDYTGASGGGYVNKTLTNGSWVIAPAVGIMTASYAEQIWTFTGPIDGSGKAYGYFVVDADGILVHAERFIVYFQPSNNGDQAKATPKFQLSKGTPT